MQFEDDIDSSFFYIPMFLLFFPYNIDYIVNNAMRYSFIVHNMSAMYKKKFKKIKM